MVNPQKIKSAGWVVVYQVAITVLLSIIASTARFKSVAPILILGTIVIVALAFRFAYLLITCDSKERTSQNFSATLKNEGEVILESNMVSSELRISFPNSFIGNNLIILDSKGVSVFKYEIRSTQTQINISTLAEGHYVLNANGIVKRFEVKR